jgi:hypothetical protein
MIADYPDAPGRLAPFLAQWDYMSAQLTGRLDGIEDEEYLWEPAPTCWTVRRRADGRTVPDQTAWAMDADTTPPRTVAWSVGHLAWGCLLRADYLLGDHNLGDDDLDWPIGAAAGVDFLGRGLRSWRSGLDEMGELDLDTVGRSAYPGGLDLQLPLLDIVWWMNKELLEYAAEIWYVLDLFAATHARRAP